MSDFEKTEQDSDFKKAKEAFDEMVENSLNGVVTEEEKAHTQMLLDSGVALHGKD